MKVVELVRRMLLPLMPVHLRYRKTERPFCYVYTYYKILWGRETVIDEEVVITPSPGPSKVYTPGQMLTNCRRERERKGQSRDIARHL